MAGQIHDQWEEVLIHTAKCDICENHNKSTLFRCLLCTLSICTPCKQKDPGDGRHSMNGGRIVFAASDAGLLSPTPPNTASVSVSTPRPETAGPAQTESRKSLPRPSKKRTRHIVVETDDEQDEGSDEVPDRSRRGKKRQKTQRFKSLSSTSKRRRVDTSPVARRGKKRRANYDIGERSVQTNERTQHEKLTKTCADQASDNQLDAEATLLGFGQHGAAFIAALKAGTRNSNPDERNLTMLAMVAASFAETKDSEDTESALAQLQVPDSETEGGQDAQARNPIFFTEADDDEVVLEPQVVHPVTDSGACQIQDVASQSLVDIAVDGIPATTLQEPIDAVVFNSVDASREY